MFSKFPYLTDSFDKELPFTKIPIDRHPTGTEFSLCIIHATLKDSKLKITQEHIDSLPQWLLDWDSVVPVQRVKKEIFFDKSGNIEEPPKKDEFVKIDNSECFVYDSIAFFKFSDRPAYIIAKDYR